jgi:hypothetical protein
MKPLLTNAFKGLISIIVSAIVTALITGQPLVGLTETKGLYQTFVQRSTPAWLFALILVWAMLASYFALTHLPKRRPKGTIHFISDSHNTGWAKQSDGEISVQLGGTFTYDGPEEVIILKAFMKGTHPTTDILAILRSRDGSDRGTTARELWLHGGVAERAIVHLRLSPLIGTPGKPLRRRVVLHDKFARDFVIGPIEFPYIGQKSK